MLRQRAMLSQTKFDGTGQIKAVDGASPLYRTIPYYDSSHTAINSPHNALAMCTSLLSLPRQVHLSLGNKHCVRNAASRHDIFLAVQAKVIESMDGQRQSLIRQIESLESWIADAKSRAAAACLPLTSEEKVQPHIFVLGVL